MANKKVSVIDTSVLMDSPGSIKELLNGGNLVIIPWSVHKELERFKLTDVLGRKASDALKSIWEANLSQNEKLIFMQANWNGINGYSPSNILDKNNSGDCILATALSAYKKYVDNVDQVVLLTHDIAMSIKAAELKFDGKKCLQVQEWQQDKGEDLASLQMSVIEVPMELVKSKTFKGCLSLDVVNSLFKGKVSENMGFLVKVVDDDKSYISHVAIFKGRYLNFLSQDTKLCQNIGPRSLGVNGDLSINWEQVLAINSLLDLNVKYFSLIGEAGTGKTFLAIASALHFMQKNQRKFKEINITRAPIPVGKTVGYMPGSLEEKMGYWTQGMMDNISVIKSLNPILSKQVDTWLGMSGDKAKDVSAEKNRIKILGFEHVRGRSIDDTVIIVDEAQNINSSEIKTFATRLGKNSRIIFTGDPTQIDDRYLKEQRNGLIWLTSVMRGDPNFSHVYFTESVRSPAVKAFLKCLKEYESRH